MMRDSSRGELLFSWVCFVLLSSVDSLTWTAQPTNPTVAVKGQDVSLTWRYSLTADELTKSNTYFFVAWAKFNASSLAYDRIAFRAKTVGQAATYSEPIAPHIVIDRATGTDFASLKIIDVRTDDEGRYKIEISVEFPGTLIAADDEVNLTVSVPPENVYVSPDQDICEGSMVTLSCNATGTPTPSITWTRVADDGTDSSPLPAMDGTYVIYNITRSSSGTYRCTATNAAGTVNRTVQVTVRYPPSVDRIVNSSNTVIEGGPFNMTCEAADDPMPKNFTWITVDTGQQHYGKVLVFPNINRSDTGEYRCEVDNQCGKDSRVQSVDSILYKPENVMLNVNISRNNVCAVTVVNFTCKAETANPEVHTYTLYENDSMVENMERPGVWIKTLNTSGHYSYRCEANNTIGTVESNQRTLTVEVPAKVLNVSNPINVTESRDVTLFCEFSGFSPPSVSLVNTRNGQMIHGPIWPLPNIHRNNTGEYICTANNACGNDSKATYINVQYQPENVMLNINISSNQVCAVTVVNFTCKAETANPEVHTYTLHENDSLVENMERPGVWIKTLNTTGHYIYRCKADNTIGAVDSNLRTLTVEVPAKVLNLSNPINVTEGGNVTLSCYAIAFSPPSVSWVNTRNGQMNHGPTWPLLNIRRNNTGEYICTASNACGNDSKATYVNVQYSPSATSSGLIKEVELGKSFSYPCPVDGNPPPAITWFKGREQNLTFLYHEETLEIRESKLNDSGWYTCFANNSLGNTSVTFQLIVKELPPTPSTGKPSEPTSKVTLHSVPITLIITNRNCAEVTQEALCLKVTSEVKDEGLEECELKRCEPGSAIVDLILRFNRSVDEGEIITILKTAAKQNKFGIFNVDPESIKSTRPEPTTPGPPPCKNSFLEDENCKIKTTIVVVIAIVSVLVIVIVSGTTAWWVHRKRKCRKDRRTHSSECEEQLQQPDDNTYSQVNSGYAHSGPPSANGADGAGRQQAVPTYASVDKSKKKKKQQEEKPPEYATVDKSKKKKKDEKVDYTYAEVDMSKKSSKKEQPKNAEGLVYADLGDFQRPQMPPVSTSPAALPPVKRPQSYEGTQYADITEFLKGDAALPKKRNSQGMEMQPQASAPANGSSQSNEVKPQGAPHSNGNSQGNEVKPQGANKDESGVPPKESKLQKAVDNTYSQVSSSYAHSGPPTGDGTDDTARQQAAAAVPTHAADKTNKKSKQKEDKSKEKKKKKKDEKEDCTYAEVDKSKKAKKKQQPKDPKCLIYADLEDFSRPLIPPIPTSPKDLPPLKMPTAYEETPYADITEFRKGDPALPKEGNSQAMEMQPQGASSANSNSQGNEVKPQGASPAKDNSQGDEVKPQGASPAIGNSQSSRDANEDESEMRPKESKL